MSSTTEAIELMRNSSESWEDAARSALDDADETFEEISGLEIVS